VGQIEALFFRQALEQNHRKWEHKMSLKDTQYSKSADAYPKIKQSALKPIYTDQDKVRLLLSASRMVPSKLPWQQILG